MQGSRRILSRLAQCLPAASSSHLPALRLPHRCCSSVSSPPSKVQTSVFNLLQQLEDVTGITAVKEAQHAAIYAEREFSRAQDRRRDMQQEVRSIQTRLKDIHAELDKTSRGEDRYLSLLTEEHGIIRKEKAFMDEFRAAEMGERDKFAELSARLREAHEKERERAERTKYWSIIGTVLGALLGIAGMLNTLGMFVGARQSNGCKGTAVSNRYRMSKLTELVETQTDPGRLNSVLTELSTMVSQQQDSVRSFVGDLRGILAKEGSLTPSKTEPQKLPAETEEALLAAIKDQSSNMSKEMEEVRRLIAIELGYASRSDGTIVYIGPEVSSLLAETESNLETKMKIQTLCNVVLVYAAIAITFPFLLGFFDK